MKYYYSLSVYDSGDLELGSTTIVGPFDSAKERQDDLNSIGYNGEEYQIQVALFESKFVKQTSQLWLTFDNEWEDHKSGVHSRQDRGFRGLNGLCWRRTNRTRLGRLSKIHLDATGK